MSNSPREIFIAKVNKRTRHPNLPNSRNSRGDHNLFVIAWKLPLLFISPQNPHDCINYRSYDHITKLIYQSLTGLKTTFQTVTCSVTICPYRDIRIPRDKLPSWRPSNPSSPLSSSVHPQTSPNSLPKPSASRLAHRTSSRALSTQAPASHPQPPSPTKPSSRSSASSASASC
jgi:hypothetical protein